MSAEIGLEELYIGELCRLREYRSVFRQNSVRANYSMPDDLIDLVARLAAITKRSRSAIAGQFLLDGIKWQLSHGNDHPPGYIDALMLELVRILHVDPTMR
jgi:hypothetical protein